MESEFGAYLKELREKKGFSVNQLAMYSGVSAAQISRVETGQRGVPKPETIKKLSDALKVPYEEMMQKAGHVDIGPKRVMNGLLEKILLENSPDQIINKQKGEKEIKQWQDKFNAQPKNKETVPEWATSKDKLDFRKMLEEDAPVMFDGVPLDEEDKEKVLKVMEAIFWDAKKKNKRKPIKD